MHKSWWTFWRMWQLIGQNQMIIWCARVSPEWTIDYRVWVIIGLIFLTAGMMDSLSICLSEPPTRLLYPCIKPYENCLLTFQNDMRFCSRNILLITLTFYFVDFLILLLLQLGYSKYRTVLGYYSNAEDALGKSYASYIWHTWNSYLIPIVMCIQSMVITFFVLNSSCAGCLQTWEKPCPGMWERNPLYPCLDLSSRRN